MMVRLLRYRSSQKATEGILIFPDGFWLATLELPWKNNNRCVSCIPAGNYKVEYLNRSASGKFEQCYWVKDVDNRTGILFHKGNFLHEIQGCILVGKTRGSLNGEPTVWSSAIAMAKMRSQIGLNSFDLLIENL